MEKVIPNFLIIGAQKAGTTSLLRYLEAHPDIFVSDEKEVSQLYDDKNYNRRFEKYPYEKYFEAWEGQKYAGNGPVNLLYFSDHTADRIYQYNPSMKVIAILRNPIDRAYSAYWYLVRNGFEKESFESALDREKQILKCGSYSDRGNFTYVSHGFYYEQLTHFYNIFNNDQLLVLFFDDLKNDARGMLKKIYQFLDIEEYYPEDMLEKKFNVGSRPKIQLISNLIFGDYFIKKIYKSAVPATLRHSISTNVFAKIRDLNLVPFAYPPMKSDTRETLKNIFQKPNKKLGEFLSRDLSNWK